MNSFEMLVKNEYLVVIVFFFKYLLLNPFPSLPPLNKGLTAILISLMD